MTSDNHGPNVTKLIVRVSARFAIPPGGGFADGVKFITDPEYRKKVLGQSEEWTVKAIAAVRAAPDNPYGDDDEKIAAVILRQLEERRENDKFSRRPKG